MSGRSVGLCWREAREQVAVEFGAGCDKLLELSPVGPWRSWERASMASRRSWVRIPSAPPFEETKELTFENRSLLPAFQFSFVHANRDLSGLPGKSGYGLSHAHCAYRQASADFHSSVLSSRRIIVLAAAASAFYLRNIRACTSSRGNSRDRAVNPLSLECLTFSVVP